MAGIPDNNGAWRRATILVRADVLERARAQKIDINTVCNQALADQLNIDLHQQPLAPEPEPLPVMVAPDGPAGTAAKPERETRAPLHPVINADDPAAVTTVMKAKKKIVVPAAKPPAPAAQPPREEPRPVQEPPKEAIPSPGIPLKEKKPAAGKRGKGDAIKKFIAEKVARGEPDDATVPKDGMYDLFARWCRDRRIVPVPERRRFTLSLKNQFALAEKTVEGVPCWMNVRLK